MPDDAPPAQPHRARTLAQNSFRRAVRWWLSLLNVSPLVRHVFVPIAAAVLGWLILRSLGYEPKTTLGHLTEEAILVAAGYLFVRETYLWGLRGVRQHVYTIARVTQDPSRAPLLQLANRQIEETADVVRGLVGAGYSVDPPELLSDWFADFFDLGGASYQALDSNLPTSYVDKYDWYLTVHKSSLRSRPRDPQRPDARVIEAHRNDLSSDRWRALESYRGFVRWHAENGVDLRWINPRRAQELRRKHGIGAATDVGLWEQFAALFTNNADESVTISLVFDRGGRHALTLSALRAFMEDVMLSSEPLKDTPLGVDTVDEALAEQWHEYVDTASRIDPNGKWAQFLLPVLANRSLVLDAAAGIGCESVLLRKHGFGVITNEVDPNLARVAARFAATQDVPVQMTAYGWEDLGPSTPGGLKYDAVLVVGNSLCLVHDAARRRDCVKAFHSILKPDGLLVIDERNFARLVEQAHAIESDPVGAFPSTLKGDPMYKGRHLRGYPHSISEHNVSWRFFRREGVETQQFDPRDQRREHQDLDLYPFRHGELFRLLKDIGFDHVDVYADLQPIASDASSMPSLESVGEAVFLTYVARRNS